MTNKKFEEPILHQSIQTMEFSQQFKQLCAGLGVSTLAGLLQYPTHELIKMPGFDLRMLNEYIAFLEKEKLGFYLN